MLCTEFVSSFAIAMRLAYFFILCLCFATDFQVTDIYPSESSTQVSSDGQTEASPQALQTDSVSPPVSTPPPPVDTLSPPIERPPLLVDDPPQLVDDIRRQVDDPPESVDIPPQPVDTPQPPVDKVSTDDETSVSPSPSEQVSDTVLEKSGSQDPVIIDPTHTETASVTVEDTIATTTHTEAVQESVAPSQTELKEQSHDKQGVEEVDVKSTVKLLDPAEPQDGDKSSLPEQPSGSHGTETSTQVPQVTKEEEGKIAGQTDKEVKAEEEGLTFNEWTQKVLAEAEKDKQDAAQVEASNSVAPSPKQRKRKNYALHDCGAKILASNPEADNAKSILNSNKDDYMRNPCKVKKWFVIELCEPILTHSVEIASLELFSSQPKSFKVSLSDRYPTKDWKFAGEFETTDQRAIQTFPILEAQDYFSKFVRVELVDHFGDEHFCPVTLFRVQGVAVEEDDNHGAPDGDDDDDDNADETLTDTEPRSKNLFESAKDTVIGIVKTVLNVSPEEANMNNTADKNETMNQGTESVNATNVTREDSTAPCTPNGSIPEGTDTTVAPPTDGKLQPQPPVPGQTDNVSIVTILKDDEQVETGSTKTLLEGGKHANSLRRHGQTCLVQAALQTSKHRRRMYSHIPSLLCQFSMLFLDTCSVQLSRRHDKGSPDTGIRSSSSLSSSSAETVSSTISASVIPTGDLLGVTEESSSSIDHTVPDTQSSSTVSVTQKIDEVKPSIDQSTNQASSQQVSSKVIKTTESFIMIESSVSRDITPTSVLDVPHTATPTLSASESVLTSTPVADPVRTTDSIPSQDIHSSVVLDPSSTLVSREPQHTGTVEATGTQSQSTGWKPDTGDVMEHTDDNQVPASIEPGLTIESSYSPSQSVGNAALPSGSEDSPSQTATLTETPRAADTDKKVPDDTVPGQMVPAVADNKTDTAPPQETNTSKTDMETDKSDTKIETKATTEEKPITTNGGPTKVDLDLVKVPVMIGNKRESAIMRLSNRVKVLEQNVSLSSRFLEELSRRYKKQSEDMMKMLNKTVARLNNLTTETELKTKLHEDEMNRLERKLENLTDVVLKLSGTLEKVDQQVTDRQMIRTTVEILIILVIFVLLHRRGRVETLSPEIRSLIEAMPNKPLPSAAPHPRRRNSLSGPATPSKKKTSHLDGGTLIQKSGSETTLDLHGPFDYDIIQPTNTLCEKNKIAEGTNKKKKKKKQKSIDSRSTCTCGMMSERTDFGETDTSWESGGAGLVFTAHCDRGAGGAYPRVPRSHNSSPTGSMDSTGSATASDRSAVLGKGKRQDSSSRIHRAGSFTTTEKLPTQVKGRKSDSSAHLTDIRKLTIGANTNQSARSNVKAEKGSDGQINGAKVSSSGTRQLDKTGIKGHKRQRSIPKQQHSHIENVGNSNRRDLSDNIRHNSEPDVGQSGIRGGLKPSWSAPVTSSCVQHKHFNGCSEHIPKPSDSTSKGKKLPQCGVSALYYGTDEQNPGVIPGRRGTSPARSGSGSFESCDSMPYNGYESYVNDGGSAILNSESAVYNPGVGGEMGMNGHSDPSDIRTGDGSGTESKPGGGFRKLFGLFR